MCSSLMTSGTLQWVVPAQSSRLSRQTQTKTDPMTKETAAKPGKISVDCAKLLNNCSNSVNQRVAHAALTHPTQPLDPASCTPLTADDLAPSGTLRHPQTHSHSWLTHSHAAPAQSCLILPFTPAHLSMVQDLLIKIQWSMKVGGAALHQCRPQLVHLTQGYVGPLQGSAVHQASPAKHREAVGGRQACSQSCRGTRHDHYALSRERQGLMPEPCILHLRLRVHPTQARMAGHDPAALGFIPSPSSSLTPAVQQMLTGEPGGRQRTCDSLFSSSSTFSAALLVSIAGNGSLLPWCCWAAAVAAAAAAAVACCR